MRQKAQTNIFFQGNQKWDKLLVNWIKLWFTWKSIERIIAELISTSWHTSTYLTMRVFVYCLSWFGLFLVSQRKSIKSYEVWRWRQYGVRPNGRSKNVWKNDVWCSCLRTKREGSTLKYRCYNQFAKKQHWFGSFVIWSTCRETNTLKHPAIIIES